MERTCGCHGKNNAKAVLVANNWLPWTQNTAKIGCHDLDSTRTNRLSWCHLVAIVTFVYEKRFL